MDDVVADGVEGRMAQDVAKQGGSCGIADIDTEDLVAVGEQPQAEMWPVFSVHSSAFYSMKSALGSWSMPVIPTTSIPFGRRVPLAR